MDTVDTMLMDMYMQVDWCIVAGHTCGILWAVSQSTALVCFACLEWQQSALAAWLAMAGKGVEMDVVEAADAYFKKFEIKSLLTQILIKLGEEQPEDPAQAIRAHLEVSEHSSLGALGGGAVVQPVPDADEEHDADESLFQACYICHIFVVFEAFEVCVSDIWHISIHVHSFPLHNIAHECRIAGWP